METNAIGTLFSQDHVELMTREISMQRKCVVLVKEAVLMQTLEPLIQVEIAVNGIR